MLLIHKPNCGKFDITTTRTSSKSHFLLKNHFHKFHYSLGLLQILKLIMKLNTAKFLVITTYNNKQNHMMKGYITVSDLDDVLQRCCYESPVGYDNVDWFVIESMKLETKVTFYFNNINKDIIIREEYEEGLKNNDIC